jgi:hypothetical protein
MAAPARVGEDERAMYPEDDPTDVAVAEAKPSSLSDPEAGGAGEKKPAEEGDDAEGGNGDELVLMMDCGTELRLSRLAALIILRCSVLLVRSFPLLFPILVTAIDRL